MKRAITTLTAALLGSAAAQEIATSLPLTSVGNKLMWTVGDQDLRLIVGVSSRLQLDVYGAQFDPQDYRSPDFYGDENYSTERPKAPVNSTFTLVDASGKVVKEQNFGVGSQDWQTFLNEDLAAGTYTLKVRTDGNGKNTFAFRLNSISAAVEADHLNVTIRSNDWVPALNINNPGGDMGIRMYDGDGPTELEAELRDAQGNKYPVKVSGQLQWDQINVPADPGNYTLYLRQPKDTYQFSNSVGFELTTGPITVVNTDTTGKLDIKAELILPDETLPTQATVNACGNTYNVDGSAGPYTLPEQKCDVSVEPIKGAEVTLTPPEVTIVKKETQHIAVQVKPTVDLAFSADKPEVCVGDVVTFTAKAVTEFERQTLPANVRVTLPAGFTANGETSVTARVDANNPGVLTFEAKATAAGNEDVKATLAPWNKTQSLGVKVLPTATQIELRRAELPTTLAGETVTVTLSIKNTSGVAAPYTLTDDPGATLEALDSTSFSGELQPGETKTLTYRARVKGEAGAQGNLKATLTSNCESSQVVRGLLTVQTPAPTPKPEIAVQRESTVRIPFDVPSTKNANQIIIAHQPPADSSYVAGSSQLSGKPIADPQVGPSGKFYWTTPGAARGVLTYKVSHEGNLPALSSPTLVGKYAGGQLSVLVGEGGLDDLNSLKMVGSGQVAEQENAGALKLPLDGTVYRERDRITIAVVSGSTDTTLPSINGVPIDAATLGKKAVDATAGTQRQEFYGIPLQPGENTVTFGGQSIKVYLAGSPVHAELTPQQLVADGINPLRIGIKLTDANNLTVGSSAITVQASTEPTQADAQPRVGSYQVKLVDGEGVLELEPMSAPSRFDVKLLLGDKVISKSFEATPSKTRVGIGMVSVGALLGGIGSGTTTIAGQGKAQGYLETPVGEGKLYVAASGGVNADMVDGVTTWSQDRTAGLPNTDNPLERYSNYGDSSTENIPLQGIDPVAFRYEHPKFNVQYRQAPVPIDVFNIGMTPTALSGFTRSNPQVSGFAAYVPGDLITSTFRANGTRVLPLSPRDVIQSDSETVELISTNPATGTQKVTTLRRLVDYTLDPVAGVLYFQRAIDLVDQDGYDQQVRVSYRINDPLGARKLAFGAQVKYRVTDELSVAAGAVSLNDVISFGARARYDNGESRADLLAAYAGGGALVNGSASISTERFTATANVHYQGLGYTGLNSSAAGLGALADATYKLTDRFGINARAVYRQDYSADATATVKNGGYAQIKGLYSFSPFTLGAGIRAGFGDEQGIAGVVSGAYEGANGLNVAVEHAQPISGAIDPTTTIKASVPVGQNVTLVARDDINWNEGHRGSMGLQARFGMTNLAVYYDLPGADGWGNRARFGADTTLPLSDKLSLGLSGSYLIDLNNTSTNETGWNVGAALRYSAERLSGTLAADVAQQPNDFRVTVRGGAAYSLNDRVTLSADATRVFSSVDANSGSNFSVSAALRASQWQGLAYLRYKDGALAGANPELIGEANLEYHVPRYAIRGGLAARAGLDAPFSFTPGSFTYQASLSGTYYVTDRFGIGAAVRGLAQPGTNYSALSLGLEGSYRALPGTWITLGYNPMGFTGIGSNIYTRQGLYLRLDMMLDDGQANGVNQPTAPFNPFQPVPATPPGNTVPGTGDTSPTPPTAPTTGGN